MTSTRSIIKEGLDWTTLSLWISLVVIGWVMIYAVDKHKFIEDGLINFQSNTGKELIFIGLSFVIGLLL